MYERKGRQKCKKGIQTRSTKERKNVLYERNNQKDGDGGGEGRERKRRRFLLTSDGKRSAKLMIPTQK